MVAHRDAFAHTALVARNADGDEEVWLLLYMVASPLYVATCKLEPVEAYEEAPQPTIQMADVTFGSIERAFKAKFAAFSTAADMPPLRSTTCVCCWT